MSIIATSPSFGETNIDPTTRNYIQDIDGVDRRQFARAAPARVLAGVANHLFARQPKMVFGQFIPTDDLWNDANTRNPLLYYTHNDRTRNGRSSLVTVLALPRVVSNAVSANTYLFNESNVLENTGAYQANVATVTLWSDLVVHRFRVSRGAEANAIVEAGISSEGGYKVVDVIVEEEAVKQLDTALHLYVDPGSVKAGGDILADFPEQARARIHDYRTTTLAPVLSWSAQANADNEWGMPASPGNQFGMAITNTVDGDSTWVNLLDHSVTTWSSSSPGMKIHCQNAAVGHIGTEAGTQVNISLTIKARISAGASNAMLRFQTPYSNTYVNVTASGGSENINVPLHAVCNSAVLDSEDGATGNKVDVYGQVDSGSLWVYSLRGWPIY